MRDLLFMLCFGLLAVGPPGVHAADDRGQPDPADGVGLAGPQDLLTGKLDIAQKAGGGAWEAERRVVPAKHQRFDRAVQVRVIDSPRAKWQVKIDVPLDDPLAEGDTVLVDFWMRTLASDDESGDGAIFVVLANRGKQWQTHRVFTAGAGEPWRHWQMPIKLHRPPGAGKNIVSLQFAGLPQTVELGGFSVTNYGSGADPQHLPITRSTYPGRGADAAWRAAALTRIDRIRKGDLTIEVVDANGQPVPDAEVTVAMQRHAFGFGSAINPVAFADGDEDYERYLRVFEQHFNKAATEGGLRWQHFFRPTPDQQKKIWARTDAMLDWLEARNIRVHAHYLMWGPLSDKTQPAELLHKPEALIAAHRQHVREKIALTRGRVEEWDTINHIVGWGRKWNDLPGGNAVYAEAIRFARELAPDAEHWVNEGQIVVGDGNRIQAYQAVLDDLAKRGAKPDGIGFMAHFRDTLLPHPQQVYERIDAFAKYGVELQFTELDVDAGADEQLQADYLRDVMIAGFSHPQMTGITLWGFWEGRHWRPDAALWRKDWTLKPAGEAWLDLVHKQWWTDASGTTNDDGRFSTRGFFGDYLVTVSADGTTHEQRIELTPDESRFNVSLPAAVKPAE